MNRDPSNLHDRSEDDHDGWDVFFAVIFFVTFCLLITAIGQAVWSGIS